jgi:HTH-type transcriptional regulator / antitoxin HigA
MSKATATDSNREPLPSSFAALNAALPLRPIRDDGDYDNAIEMIDRLAVLGRRSPDQADYLETLTELVGKYEDEHYAADLSRQTPVETLRRLCEQNRLSASALGELLGNRSLGSKVLRGERQLSKEHIRRLCDHFAVSADLFLA